MIKTWKVSYFNQFSGLAESIMVTCSFEGLTNAIDTEIGFKGLTGEAVTSIVEVVF